MTPFVISDEQQAFSRLLITRDSYLSLSTKEEWVSNFLIHVQTSSRGSI
jgi:hypothetical protein